MWIYAALMDAHVGAGAGADEGGLGAMEGCGVEALLSID